MMSKTNNSTCCHCIEKCVKAGSKVYFKPQTHTELPCMVRSQRRWQETF